MGICRSSLLNQKHDMGWFLLQRSVDVVRLCCLHIISRNHSNTLLLVNLKKIKTCPKYSNAATAICSDIRILTV